MNSTVKKSVFVLYLLEAPAVTVILVGWMTMLVVCNFGLQIPGVDRMHAMVKHQVYRMHHLSAPSNSKKLAGMQTEAAESDPKSSESKRSSELFNEVDTVQKSNTPAPFKILSYFYLALFSYAPWPVGLCVVAILLSMVNGIWFLIHPFKKSFLWGIGCIFVPFVSTVFEYKYWQEVRRPFEVGLICSALVGIAMGTALGAYRFIPADALRNSFAEEISHFKEPPATGMSIHSSDIELTTGKDAFFESALAAVTNSERGRTRIESLVKNEKKNYSVNFNDSGDLLVSDADLSTSKNRDKIAAIIEAAFLKNYDADEIRKQLAKDGTPAIAAALKILVEEDVSSVKASELGVEATEFLIADAIAKGNPVVISAKNERELNSKQRLASPCYAVIATDEETHQVLLYSCKKAQDGNKENLPGIENVGNGLIKVPVLLFPKYVRYISLAGTS
jgi:hypothetical protein